MIFINIEGCDNVTVLITLSYRDNTINGVTVVYATMINFWIFLCMSLSRVLRVWCITAQINQWSVRERL